MTKLNQLFDLPRWKDGPHICCYENLPAFPTLKTLNDFHEDCKSVTVTAKWKCPVCNEWHSKMGGMNRQSASGSQTDLVLPPYKVQAEKDGYKLADLK